MSVLYGNRNRTGDPTTFPRTIVPGTGDCDHTAISAALAAVRGDVDVLKADKSVPCAEGRQVIISVTGGSVGGPTLSAGQWVSYTPAVTEDLLGAWQLDGSVFVVPESGVYAVSGQVVTVAPEGSKESDVSVRIVSAAGVLGGATYRVGGTTVLNLSDSIRLEAGDRVQVQVYTEAGRLAVDPGSLALSLRKTHDAPNTVRTPWINPPYPFSEKVVEATDPKERSLVLTVPATASASWAGLSGVGVEAFGGATATVDKPVAGQPTVANVGANVGRLFRVTGVVGGATRLGLQTGTNGYVSTNVWNSTGKNTTGLQLLPSLYEAKATSTRCTFDGKSGGQESRPGHIYVRDTRATLTVMGQGATIGGGPVTLTDVTPHDFIGDVITVKGTKAADSSTAIKWSSSTHGIVPIRDEANGYGRWFGVSSLPKGDYRIKGSITVRGTLGYFILKYGDALYPTNTTIQPCRITNRVLGSSSAPADLYPSDMGNTANLTINNFETTYYYDTYFDRTASGWSQIEIANVNGIASQAVDIEGELEIRRMGAEDPLWWFDLEMDQFTGTGASVNPVYRNSAQSGIGPTVLNGGRAWSSYPALGKSAENSGNCWFPQHWGKQPQKWTLDLTVTNGSITAAGLLNRRVGANNDTGGGAVKNLGGGNYRVELLIPAGAVDGGVDTNFGHSYITASAGAVVNGKLRVEQTGPWIPLSAAQG
jgi:hypothetical protein